MKEDKFSSALAKTDRNPCPLRPGKRQLWHTIDKFPEELACQNRATHAKDLLRPIIQAKWPELPQDTINVAIDAAKDMGSVVLLRKYMPPDVMSRNALKVFMRNFPAYNL
eukprot:7104435-Pyramimonas_sp.AAC.1